MGDAHYKFIGSSEFVGHPMAGINRTTMGINLGQKIPEKKIQKSTNPKQKTKAAHFSRTTKSELTKKLERVI